MPYLVECAVAYFSRRLVEWCFVFTCPHLSTALDEIKFRSTQSSVSCGTKDATCTMSGNQTMTKHSLSFGLQSRLSHILVKIAKRDPARCNRSVPSKLSISRRQQLELAFEGTEACPRADPHQTAMCAAATRSVKLRFWKT